MAARRSFDQGQTQPGMPFETAGGGDQAYGGFLGPRSTPEKRRLSAEDEPDEMLPRYIPPATMDILFRESAKRGRGI